MRKNKPKKNLNRVIKYPVQLSAAEQRAFSTMTWACRKFWNDCLGYWQLRYKMSLATGAKTKTLSEYDLYKVITHWRNLTEVEAPDMQYLKLVPVEMLRDTAYSLKNAWNMFFKHHSRPPKFKSIRKPLTSLYFSNTSFSGESFQLGRLFYGSARLWQLKQADEKVTGSRLVQVAPGRFELHVSLRKELPAKKIGNSVLGLDTTLGETIGVLSTGQSVGLNQTQRLKLKKGNCTQRRLQRQQARSYRLNNKRKTKNAGRRQQRINAIYRHRTRTLDYAFNLIGYTMATSADAVRVEGFNPAHLRGRHLGHSMHTASMGKLWAVINHHCDKHGTNFKQAPAQFPSTKACHKCDLNLPESLDVSIKFWVCPQCGHLHQRDLNASKRLGLSINAEASANADGIPAAGTAVVKDVPDCPPERLSTLAVGTSGETHKTRGYVLGSLKRTSYVGLTLGKVEEPSDLKELYGYAHSRAGSKLLATAKVRLPAGIVVPLRELQPDGSIGVYVQDLSSP